MVASLLTWLKIFGFAPSISAGDATSLNLSHTPEMSLALREQAYRFLKAKHIVNRYHWPASLAETIEYP
jgi:hypothetical protein